MSSDTTFEYGDRIRHDERPEWGVGTIIKVEITPMNGTPAHRLSVRFANAGLKRLVSSRAPLSRVTDNDDAAVADDRPTVSDFDEMQASGWLAPMAEKKIRETMISLPLPVRDPFRTLRQRLESHMDLYRFTRTGGALIDWAVAQSGLDDPLSRFTRHELEELFDRWESERDQHLSILLAEARQEPGLVDAVAATAPKAARDIVSRRIARR